jgi:hypothetical protein
VNLWIIHIVIEKESDIHFELLYVCAMRAHISRNPSDPLENSAKSQNLLKPAWILGLNLLDSFCASKLPLRFGIKATIDLIVLATKIVS